MTTLLMSRKTIPITLGGGPLRVEVDIPGSNQFLGFVFTVSGPNTAEALEIQGSFDGVTFFTLDSTTHFLPTPHFTTNANPVLVQLELYAPLPGGLRIRSTNATLTVDGVVQVMMYNSAFNPGRTY